MNWPAAEEIPTLMPMPDGYRLEQLDRAGIGPLIAAIKLWHPHIAVGVASGYLRDEFYSSRVFLAAETERDIFVAVIRCGDELVGMWSVEREVDSLAIYARLIVVAPAHRSAGLAGAVSRGSENFGRVMGAEFLYALATLKHIHLQRALEGAGYRLLGFFPGYDREEVAPGVVKRVYQAVYAKLLVDEDCVLRPHPKNMTPRALRIFELLFPD